MLSADAINVDIATTRGHLDIVSELLNIEDVRSRVVVKNNQILHIAIMKGCSEIVLELLEIETVATCHIDVLKAAIHEEQLRVVLILLEICETRNITLPESLFPFGESLHHLPNLRDYLERIQSQALELLGASGLSSSVTQIVFGYLNIPNKRKDSASKGRKLSLLH